MIESGGNVLKGVASPTERGSVEGGGTRKTTEADRYEHAVSSYKERDAAQIRLQGKYAFVGMLVEGRRVVGAMVNGSPKFGYLDEKDQEVVQPKYDGARNFREGRGAVMRYDGYVPASSDNFADDCKFTKPREQWGFVDLSGEVATGTHYDKVSDFSNGKASVENGCEFYTIDPNGSKLKQ